MQPTLAVLEARPEACTSESHNGRLVHCANRILLHSRTAIKSSNLLQKNCFSYSGIEAVFRDVLLCPRQPR